MFTDRDAKLQERCIDPNCPTCPACRKSLMENTQAEANEQNRRNSDVIYESQRIQINDINLLPDLMPQQLLQPLPVEPIVVEIHTTVDGSSEEYDGYGYLFQ